ncbi:hypothetical protein [Knoellia subterranea]|nr:hypothetical protein [Knoellia subterranea]
MLTSVAAARRGWRLVAVFVLVLAVVGMHSMGAGHHGAAGSAGSESHQMLAAGTIGAPTASPTTGSGSHHSVADPDGATVTKALNSEVITATCFGCLAPGGDALAAMCLAVVSSLLALALLVALRHLLRGRVALMLLSWSHAGVAVRSPLRRMALSPIEVCVLRT